MGEPRLSVGLTATVFVKTARSLYLSIRLLADDRKSARECWLRNGRWIRSGHEIKRREKSEVSLYF
jgi:hypothetical protein